MGKNDVSFWKKSFIFSKIAHFGKILKNVSRIIFLLKNSQNVQNLFFFCKKKIECWQNILEKFQKQWTWLISSRISTKVFTAREFSKLSEFGLFWKNRLTTWKKNVLKLSKTLNFASFFFKYVSNFTVGHVFWRRSIIWVFWEKRCFFSKEYLKVFKNTKQGCFPSECFSKVFFCWCNLQTFKTWVFLKNNDVFCDKNLEKNQELYLAFLIKIACQTFILHRNSQNNRIFGLFGEIDVVCEKILIFLQNRQTWPFCPSLRFKKYKCPRELKTFNILRFPGK